MIFQYQDEDSGEQVQMYRLARAFDVISWDYDNIAAAMLRHAEFPEVRKKHLSLSNSTTVSDLSIKTPIVWQSHKLQCF